MAGVYLYGWDETNEIWVKCQVTTNGKLIINPNDVIDDTPEDGVTDKAISSNWAYDHKEDASAHHSKYTDNDAANSWKNRSLTIQSGVHRTTDLTGISLVYIDSTDGIVYIEGFSGGTDGQVVLLLRYNYVHDCYVYHEHSSVTAINRILTTNGDTNYFTGNLTGAFFLIYYNNRWMLHNWILNNPAYFLSGTPLSGVKTRGINANCAYAHWNDFTTHVTGGNSHNHTSGAGAQIDHTTLSNIGTNTHAQIDSYISDLTPRIRVTLTSTQAISSGAPAKVQFNTETYDNFNEYDNSTNYKFTAASDGYYRIDLSLRFATATWVIGTFLYLSIYVNGVEYSRPFWKTIVNTAYNNHMMNGYDIVNLSAGDYVEIYVYQGDGVSHNLDNSALYNKLLINKLK